MLMDDNNHLIQIKTLDEDDRQVMFEVKVVADENYIVLNKLLETGIDDIDSIRLSADQIDLVIETLNYVRNNLLGKPHWPEGTSKYEI